MKIQYLVNCTTLHICKGFLKISILNYNNNDEIMDTNISSWTQDRSWLREAREWSECS